MRISAREACVKPHLRTRSDINIHAAVSVAISKILFPTKICFYSILSIYYTFEICKKKNIFFSFSLSFKRV